MPKLSPKDIRHVAELARLEVTEEEIEKRLREVNEIVGYFETLSKVSTQGVETTEHVGPQGTAIGTPMAQDEVQKSFDPGDAVKNAPDRQDHFFKVPRMIGEES